jgi:hypothetical protein
MSINLIRYAAGAARPGASSAPAGSCRCPAEQGRWGVKQGGAGQVCWWVANRCWLAAADPFSREHHAGYGANPPGSRVLRIAAARDAVPWS